MASPVKDAKLKAQLKWPGATIADRGKGYIRHQHPTESNRFVLDIPVGGLGWHFGNEPFSSDHEVDTAWVDADPILDEPWQKKMVLADYNTYAFREPTLGFDRGQLIEYVHPASGEAINFQPMQLQWTNDIDQISPIADPSTVSATIDDDTLTWVDAYGPGIDFCWETQTVRLTKYVNINSLAELGSPPQFIIDGGNPVLRVELLFQKSADIEIWVNGALWDEKSNNPQTTQNHVEFKLESETMWNFKAPLAWDSDPDAQSISPTMRLRKSANNLFVEILTPWAWLETATYPLVVDATVEDKTDANEEDGYWSLTMYGGGIWYTGVEMTVGETSSNESCHALHIHEVATINSGDIVNTDTYISYANRVGLYKTAVLTYAIEADDPSLPGAASDAEALDLTEASASWTTSSGSTSAYYNSGELQAVVQEIIDRPGWSAGNNMAIVTKENAPAGNRTMIMTYDESADLCPLLHIDYTAGGGPTAQAVAGLLVFTGTSWQTTYRDQDTAGTLVLTGAISDFKLALSRFLGGTLSLSGAPARMFKSFLELSGLLALAGTASTMFKSFLEFAGTLTLTGAVQSTVKWLRTLTGTLVPSGALALKSLWKRALAGTLSLAGQAISDAQALYYQAVAGALAPGGTLSNITHTWVIGLSGVLSFTGSAIARGVFIIKSFIRMWLTPQADPIELDTSPKGFTDIGDDV